MKEVQIKDLSLNPFDTIGKDWLLIGAEKQGRVNAMTASWGGMGVLWRKNVLYVFIRESRFTKEFVDGSDTFSVTVFDHERYKDMLAYMGRVSGRDEDKVAKCGLTVVKDVAPYFAESKLAFLCKKISRVPIRKEMYLDDGWIHDTFYGDEDYHDMYVGEIIKVLEND